MAFWSKTPDLQPGDSIRWRTNALLSADQKPTVGGKLYLTDHTLVFRARSQERVFRLAEIERIERVERTGTLYDGGMRRRLRVVFPDQTSVMFIVRHLDDVIARLSAAVSGSDTTADAEPVATPFA